MRLTINQITKCVDLERHSWFRLDQRARYDAFRGHAINIFCFPPTRPGNILNESFSKYFHMHSLISHSEVTIVEVVSENSVLAGTAESHLQDDLSYRRSFACHRTQIYSPYYPLYLDEKYTLNKSTSGIILRK